MSNGVNVFGVDSFIKSCLAYPPIQIFGEKEVTKKSKKAEERIVEICEELFRYNKKTPKDIRYLSEMSAAYRDVQVAIKMSLSYDIKEEYMAKVLAEFVSAITLAIHQMNSVYKKDPVLWNYYQGFAVHQKVIRESVVKYIIDVHGQSLLDSFKAELARKS